MAVSILSNRLIDTQGMTASFVSEHFSVAGRAGFSVHAVFTGSPTGSFYLSVSINGIDWILMDGSTQAVSAAGDILWNVNDSKYLLGRLHYSFSSGSGTTNAYISMKEA
jgi:hypothetical protein